MTVFARHPVGARVSCHGPMLSMSQAAGMSERGNPLSGTAKPSARCVQIILGVDPARRRVNLGNSDGHASFQRTKLFQALGGFQR